MAESLITLAQPFFLRALSLVSEKNPDDVGDLSRLQKDLTAELQAIEQKVNSGQAQISADEWAIAKKGLIYWVDEILTNHIDGWQDYVLEHVFFGQRNRAWRFYIDGEEALVTSSSDAAEIYYLAVVLGFVGDIEGGFQEKNAPLPGKRSDPDEARKFWAQQLQTRLQQQQSAELQGEKLEGHIDPLTTSAGLTTWSAFFASMVLCLLVLGSWYLLRGNN